MQDDIHEDVAEDLEGAEVDTIVELFSLDLAIIGDGIHRFAPSLIDGSMPSFGGDLYSVIPFQSEGFEWSGDGPLPRPRLRFGVARDDGEVSSAIAILLALVKQHDDLIGAKVTRFKTLRKHLDDGTDPDGQKHLGFDVFFVEQKPEQTAGQIEFLLSSALDMEDVAFPRRLMLNRCPFRYRRGQSDGSFDYSNVNCPYTGPRMFNLSGTPVTTAAADRCPKSLSGCKLRFAAGTPEEHLAGENIPFGGFPAVGRVS